MEKLHFSIGKMMNSFDWWRCQGKQQTLVVDSVWDRRFFLVRVLESRRYTFQHWYWNENLLILIISFVQTKLVQTWGEAMKGWSRMQCVNISTAMAVASCHPDMSSKQTSGLYSIICIRTPFSRSPQNITHQVFVSCKCDYIFKDGYGNLYNISTDKRVHPSYSFNKVFPLSFSKTILLR